jgi:hypothetical protein
LLFTQACSSGPSQQDIGIIQAELDKEPAMQMIPNGNSCTTYPAQNPASLPFLYRNVRHVHIQSLGTTMLFNKVAIHCSYFTWDVDTGVEQAPAPNREGMQAQGNSEIIGKYVVDAIVSEEQINGETIAKFNARFEPNELGKALAVPGLRPPPDHLKMNMEAVITKNSAGVAIAQIANQ